MLLDHVINIAADAFLLAPQSSGAGAWDGTDAPETTAPAEPTKLRAAEMANEIEILTKNLKIAEECGDKALEGNLHAGIGKWYGKTGNY